MSGSEQVLKNCSNLKILEDIGQWHPDGTLSVIDRMSNLIKLSHGEYVAVEKIESKYKNSEFVEQIMVYGDSSKAFPIALVVPSIYFPFKY
jgi:long-chain acyl-CoA synthetase